MKRTVSILIIIAMSIAISLSVSAESYVTIFTKDGRTRVVEESKLDAWLKVGWYEGIEVYNKAGNVKTVSPFNLESEKKNGWDTDRSVAFTLLYAPDGRIIEVTNDRVEAQIKVGWSKTPCDYLMYETAYGTGGALHYNHNGTMAYIERGTKIIYESTFDYNRRLKRFEIPDTVTTIEKGSLYCDNYSSFYIAVERIGIPKSVTDISDNLFSNYRTADLIETKKLTIYCEKGSAAEAFAKRNKIKYVYATLIYHINGARTMMVTDNEKNAYLRSGLWYTYPAVKIYNKDGKTLLINRNDLDEYKASGWTDIKKDVFTTVYAPDGRTKEIGKNQLEAYKKVGWFATLAEVQTTMCTLDGRNKVIYKSQVDAYKKVGWYTLDDYINSFISKKDYVRAVNVLEALHPSESWENKTISETEYKKQLDNIYKACGTPIIVTKYEIVEKSGTPTIYFYFKNITSKTIVAYNFSFKCYDAYGYYLGKVTGNATRISLTPYLTIDGDISLFSSRLDDTYSITTPILEKVAFSDGTVWYR